LFARVNNNPTKSRILSFTNSFCWLLHHCCCTRRWQCCYKGWLWRYAEA